VQGGILVSLFFCGPLEFCPKILAAGFPSPKTPVFIFAVTEDPGFQ
jgi:hypothetical protein